MSLEEKIKKEKEILERKKHQYEGDMKSSDIYKERYKDEIASLKKEIEEHESLVAWLEELKSYRKNSCQQCDYGECHEYHEKSLLEFEIKNRTIDNFCADIKKEYDNDYCPNVSDYLDYEISIRELFKIAEQLKDSTRTLSTDYDGYDR